ncbi:MAG: ROK family protein [Candidatus Omnitrophica bacterium]|nr:ROK family protein [Candidatus Omnitrophota bacterium]MCB9720429.1 ROK family protein [Candidatus Omnitrophota bacterium]
MANKIFCGVDVGGTKILAALVDGRGKVMARKKCPTPQGARPQRIYDEIRNHLSSLFSDNDVTTDDLGGIGMGIPGIVKPNQIDILRTPNIQLAGFPLAQRLSKHFGVRVILGNDVNLGLLGEQWLGAGQRCKNIIGLFPGTGVGGGIILDGKLLIGEQGVAGELGHVIIDQSSAQLNAGLPGTIEGLASRRAVEREIRAAIEKGEKSVVGEMLGDQTDQIKSKIIAQALAKKDRVVVRVVNDVCKTLGNACISMRHIFNPELIILGGGLVEACGDYILPRVRRRSGANPFLSGIDACRIVPSQLGDDAVVLGAVALLKDSLKTDPALKSKLYPHVTLQRGKILLDELIMHRDFYIRADGKVRQVNGRVEFKNYYQKSTLDAALLTLICRKKTKMLIVAQKDRRIRLTREGRDFLLQNGTEIKILSMEEAIRLYSAWGKRKALFVSHVPSV